MANTVLRKYVDTCWSMELRSSLFNERAWAREAASSSSSEKKKKKRLDFYGKNKRQQTQ